MVTKHVDVTGQVQGVGFRNHTRRAAATHDVTGWVRNNDDGSVTAVLQGSQSDVRRVIDDMRSGPALSRVESVDVAAVDTPDSYASFTVRR